MIVLALSLFCLLSLLEACILFRLHKAPALLNICACRASGATVRGAGIVPSPGKAIYPNLARWLQLSRSLSSRLFPLWTVHLETSGACLGGSSSRHTKPIWKEKERESCLK